MRTPKKMLLTATILPLFLLVSGCSKCVRFNSLPPAAQWGAPAGHSAGDVVHAEDDIAVAVQEFYWSATSTHLGRTEVRPSFTVSGQQSIFTNNINLEFDFTQLPFTPNEVTVIFRHSGGFENFSVNGHTVDIGELAPGNAGGVSWTVDAAQLPGGRIGKLTVVGDVTKLKIGGQELSLESVCARKTID